MYSTDEIKKMEDMVKAMLNEIKLAKANANVAQNAAKRGNATGFKGADHAYMESIRKVAKMAKGIASFAEANF